MRDTSHLCDVELEQALVALILADNANLDRIGDLTPDDVTDPVLSAAMSAAMELYEDRQGINLVTLKQRMSGIHIDEDRTGLHVLRDLAFGGALPSMDNISQRLRALAIRRRLVEYLDGILEDVADESRAIRPLISDATERLNDFVADANAEEKTEFDLHSASEDFIEWLQSGDPAIEITTGLTDLDNTISGWHRGEFAIIAGRPSMGKSTIALSSMLRTAARGNAVMFFSLEMTRDQVVARALADFAYQSQAPLAYSDLKPGRVGDREITRLWNARDAFDGLPMVIETKNGLTVGDIIGRVRRVKEQMAARGTPLALVVIDHLLKIRPSKRYAGNPVKEIDEVSEAMCVLAKSENVAVVGLHQLNRSVEGRDNQRPVMSDLRGSGSLEQDADVVLFVYRPAYPLERQAQEEKDAFTQLDALEKLKNIGELQVAKQRNGPTRSLKFYVDMQANVVRDSSFGGR